ncbi:MAG TPA: NrfD/PsrC family molybdoenzyme membrane anchor subunit [Thermoanaerobaculia bacterium]|nr:NrfD/PsrC family molybdoenzyme membrane anchor subunit [Thermoanaerobaculia bacterium]
MNYQDQPLFKPPVWTWEIPTYFFVGGAAGAAAVIGVAAQVAGEDEKLIRDARWIAAIGANLSTPLLIADLGRPGRFLNMLRVFNPQSPMSVGAWTVAVFGGASTATLLLPIFAPLSALTGLGMATYTGVLLGVTAIPVWKENARVLPVHFAASALGTACSLLELRGHKQRALSSLALGAALFETAAPIEEGALMKTAGVLSGPVPFVLRLIGRRKAAAAATILGSLLTRFAWVEAGRVSSRRSASTTSGPAASAATAAPPAQTPDRT